MLEDRKTAPAQVRSVKFVGKDTEFSLIIHEGRKRQIRLMLQDVGHRVVYLQRVQQGPLRLGGLKIGTWRRLNVDEIQKLKKT